MRRKETMSRPCMGGVQRLYDFDNGYQASVVSSRYSYGGDKGLWEMAVMRDGAIVYDTLLTDDVIGWLSDDELEQKLDELEALEVAS